MFPSRDRHIVIVFSVLSVTQVINSEHGGRKKKKSSRCHLATGTVSRLPFVTPWPLMNLFIVLPLDLVKKGYRLDKQFTDRRMNYLMARTNIMGAGEIPPPYLGGDELFSRWGPHLGRKLLHSILNPPPPSISDYVISSKCALTCVMNGQQSGGGVKTVMANNY